MRHRNALVGLVTAATLVAASPSILAQSAAVERGRLIAEGRCARCHSVGPGDTSPQRDVIPFRDLAVRFPVEMLVEALATGVVGGHEEMPMTDLGRDDVRALLAYLDTFAPAGSRYLVDLPWK